MPNVTGFTRPTLPQLIARVEADINARLPGADSRLRRSVLRVIALVIAGVAHLLYGFISFVAQQILPDTAVASFLVRHASFWEVPKKAASKATGNVTFAGTNAVVIVSGTTLTRADSVLFTTDAEVTISGGTAIAAVTAVVAGSSGATVAATLLTLVSLIEGIQSIVTVDGAGLGGAADIETDDANLVRILARVQKPPAGGDQFDYIAWALEVAGVTRAWSFPLELGIGTVVVRFVRDDDSGTIIPDAGEIATVQALIDLRRPVTADVTVLAPTAAVQNFTIAVSPDTADIRTAITTELTDFLRREGVPGGTLILSRIDEAISIAEGEFSHVRSVPAADVVLTDSQIATMGVITWV